MGGQQVQQGVPRGARPPLAQSVEGLLDLLRAHREDRPVVHVELHQVLEADPVHVLPGLREPGVLHLVGHVGDLQLRGEVAQGAHQMRDLLHRDHAVQEPGLGGVLVLRSYLRIVEVILHVAEEGTILPAIQELDEGLGAGATHDACIGNRLRVDEPLIHSEVIATACESILALVVYGNRCDLTWVRNKPHALVGVSIQGQLHKSQDLLVGGVEHELVLAVRF